MFVNKVNSGNILTLVSRKYLNWIRSLRLFADIINSRLCCRIFVWSLDHMLHKLFLQVNIMIYWWGSEWSIIMNILRKHFFNSFEMLSSVCFASILDCQFEDFKSLSEMHLKSTLNVMAESRKSASLWHLAIMHNMWELRIKMN